MYYDQTAAKNPYEVAGSQAQEIREASLRNKADETQKYLINAHGVLDELEDAMHGPQPREASKSNDPRVPPPQLGHPGLRFTLTDNCSQAAMLMSRLQTLLGSL
jgi:hypothetical protein